MNENLKAIEVTDLTVAYREKPVLWDVDLDVPPGVLMAIVGPNGAGKTTLLKSILGLIKPAAGRVLIHGRPYAEQRQLVILHLRRHVGPRGEGQIGEGCGLLVDEVVKDAQSQVRHADFVNVGKRQEDIAAPHLPRRSPGAQLTADVAGRPADQR